jgi:hypothetical protein
VGIKYTLFPQDTKRVDNNYSENNHESGIDGKWIYLFLWPNIFGKDSSTSAIT